MNQPTPFLITIDTEGDNLWSAPKDIQTKNARFLPRFQELCERYGQKPTYLVNYEMAIDPFFQELARDAQQRGVAEIGMHLHAWHSPPRHDLTGNDYTHLPYLIEYPDSILEQKIDYMTKLLEDTFGSKMRSHRAGRWSFNEKYAKKLCALGYSVDCSVTPTISWKRSIGDPKQAGGTDFSEFSNRPYFLDPENISKSGNSSLLELPMTIIENEAHRSLRKRMPKWLHHRKLGRRYFKKAGRPIWLRPNGHNRSEMLNVIDTVCELKLPYAQFMLHSSEFMPEGSPHFLTSEAIDRLYDDLEALFSGAQDRYIGKTLSEFYDLFCQYSGK